MLGSSELGSDELPLVVKGAVPLHGEDYLGPGVGESLDGLAMLRTRRALLEVVVPGSGAPPGTAEGELVHGLTEGFGAGPAKYYHPGLAGLAGNERSAGTSLDHPDVRVSIPIVARVPDYPGRKVCTSSWKVGEDVAVRMFFQKGIGLFSVGGDLLVEGGGRFEARQ